MELPYHMPTVQTVLCDGGYTGEDFATKIKNLTGATKYNWSNS